MLLLASFLFPMAAGVCVSLMKGTKENARNLQYTAVLLLTDLLGVLALLCE